MTETGRAVGKVVWITGLSGAGKTTVARRVQELLQQRGVSALLLDGDALRDAMRDPHYGYDRESRLNGAHRYARFAKLVADQGFVAVVATISLFHEIHAWNRENLPGYLEVFLDVPEEIRRERDPKGLYRRHAAGGVTSMTGLDLAPEMPSSPDLHLRNEKGPEGIDHLAHAILAAIEGAGTG